MLAQPNSTSTTRDCEASNVDQCRHEDITRGNALVLRTVPMARLDLLSVLLFDNVGIPLDSPFPAKKSSGIEAAVPRLDFSEPLAAGDDTKPIVVSAHVIHDEASLLAARAIVIDELTLIPVDTLIPTPYIQDDVRWVDVLRVSASHSSFLLRVSCFLDYDSHSDQHWSDHIARGMQIISSDENVSREQHPESNVNGYQTSAELVVVYTFEHDSHSDRGAWLRYLRELQLSVTSGGYLDVIPVPSTEGVVRFAQQTFRRGPVFSEGMLPEQRHLIPLFNFVLEAFAKESRTGSSYASDTPVTYAVLQHPSSSSESDFTLPITPSALTEHLGELQYLAFSIAWMARSLPFADEEPMVSYARKAAAIAGCISEGKPEAPLERARLLHAQLQEAHALHAFWYRARQMQLEEPSSDEWHADEEWTHGLAPHNSNPCVRVVEGAGMEVSSARAPVAYLRAESGYTIVGWRVTRVAGTGQWRKASPAVILASQGELEFRSGARPGPGQPAARPSRWRIVPYVVHRGMPLHPVHQLFLQHWRVRDEEEGSSKGRQ